MPLHPYLGYLAYDSGGAVYVEVLALYSLKDIDMIIGKGNKTHLGSTNKRKRKMAGWEELSDLTATGEFDSAKYTVLLGLKGLTKTWKLRLNDGTTATNGSAWVFTGFLSKLGNNEFNRDQDDPIETSIEITPDGDTFTPTAAA